MIPVMKGEEMKNPARDVESQAWIEEHLQPAIPVGCAPDLVWAMDPIEFEPTDDGAVSTIPRKINRCAENDAVMMVDVQPGTASPENILWYSANAMNTLQTAADTAAIP